MKHIPCIFITLAAVLLVAGCGKSKPKGLPPLYPCTVTFTQDGQPLAGAAVVLTGAEGSNFWSVSGVTNPEGSVSLTTQGPYKGVPAGKYKVMVEKKETENRAKTYRYFTEIDPKFAEKATTPFELEVFAVKDKTKNTFTFDAGAKKKIYLSPPITQSTQGLEPAQ